MSGTIGKYSALFLLIHAPIDIIQLTAVEEASTDSFRPKSLFTYGRHSLKNETNISLSTNSTKHFVCTKHQSVPWMSPPQYRCCWRKPHNVGVGVATVWVSPQYGCHQPSPFWQECHQSPASVATSVPSTSLSRPSTHPSSPAILLLNPAPVLILKSSKKRPYFSS